MGSLEDLIRRKNEAFQALEKADREIAKRERAHRKGRAGPVPDAWRQRRRELAQALDAARLDVIAAQMDDHDRRLAEVLQRMIEPEV